LIARKQGAGSFISHGGRVEAPGEHLEGFVETIRRAGAKPTSRILSLKTSALPSDVAAVLRQPPAARGFRVDTVYRADASPVIFGIVYVPRVRIRSLTMLEGRRRWTSMREFFHSGLKIPARYARLTILADGATAETATVLGLECGAPVLVMEGVTYTDGDEPLMFTRAHFRTDRYRLTVLRQ